MNRLQILKSVLTGGASVLAFATPAAAKVFDIPNGDLAAALGAYMRQSGLEIVYLDDVVRGHRSQGAKGNYTESAALEQVLRGTGFTARAMPQSNAIGIVPEPHTEMVRTAQTMRRAAPPPLAPAQAGVETVVVTAQKKSENIQQVPIAVTALSQAQLTERQIAGGPDLIKEVPNLTFSKTNFTGYNIEIRGIGTQAISVTTDPAVAVAFNDIPFIRNHFFEQEFYDLDDAEVLRGPQGTLYGRNATAGVVNIKSALPTDQYEAMVSADMGNFSNRRLEAMINLPIAGDKFDIRLAGEWTKRDGYSFNTTTNESIDGRDLWSGRATLAWKPASNVQTYVVWEHFYEDDNRIRSGKQLCKTAPIFNNEQGGGYGTQADFLSQGCEDTSLYSPSAFEVPNGYSLAYYAPLDAAGAPTQGGNAYSETTQSTNLRDIQSTLSPTYKVKNDTLEWNTNWQINQALTFVSQTGYNNDFLWSTEDYNRFDSTKGAFVFPGDQPQAHITLPDPAAGTNGVPSNAGIFCDPQLGCSDRLVLEDLSDEHAWQFSQEFRLASNFSGPFNFSVGGNYLHYETEENYYVFINTLTSLLVGSDAFGNPPYVPNVSDNSQCLWGGKVTANPANAGTVFSCDYVDPNPIGSLNNQGHNYFLSQNPYLLNSYAVFGETYYNLTDNLKITLGARWTDDQKHFIDIPSELIDAGYGYPITGIVDQQWDRWTGRFVTDWTPELPFTDQTLVYFSAAHGYKAGGANPPGPIFPCVIGGGLGALSIPDHPLTFKPEYIQAFELGSKNTLLDNALTLNGDIFYYNYTGYQISEIVDRTAINNNYNAHVEGAELETNWEPLPGLKFGFEGGFEQAILAGGNRSIDLMDRTAGNPDWVVVKPSLTQASNCILPAYFVLAASNLSNACNDAYFRGLDPITGLPYVQNPTTNSGGNPPPAGYPGFDPLSVDPNAPPNVNNGLGLPPNNGEGFNKNLSGHQLPNAPHFTASLTAEYTMPVSDNWAATLHGDFYWQSQSWARVFEDAIDKIHGYSTTNVSLILTSDNGWQVMGYVKNVFNATAITGTFLNSDDTGLTTNIFLTDPRLYGIRVTKQLDQNDGFWGSDYSGYDFFTGLFSDTDNGRPPLWVELGGSFSNLSDASQTFAPSFLSVYAPNGLKSPLSVEQAPHYGFDEEAKVSFQPDSSEWVISAAIRYGRSAANAKAHQQFQNAGEPVKISPANIPPTFASFFPQGKYQTFYPTAHFKFADALAHQSETHSIMDFEAGKDVGLGLIGPEGSSIVSVGIRLAQFTSRSDIYFNGQPDLRYPTAPITNFAGKYQFYNNTRVRFHNYSALARNEESFHGLGPKLDWNASTSVSGNEADGEITVDWGANFAVLFGRQRAQGSHQSTVRSYYLKNWSRDFSGLATNGRFKKVVPGRFVNYQLCSCGALPGGPLDGKVPPTNHHTNMAAHNRSRMVAVPNLGGFIGLSMKYRNAKVSFGYRADEFFGAMDGGIDTQKSENRGFFGPYAKISIGVGG